MRHFKYLSYVVRHKWFVFLACCRVGIPLRGLLHDASKFFPSEWLPYTNYFYGSKRDSAPRSKTGYYKPTDTGNAAFDFAWLLHQKRNRHHWQWWILPEDEGGVKILPMPMTVVKEMVCDWQGAARAQGVGNRQNGYLVAEWYREHRNRMQLHPVTAERIDRLLVTMQIGLDNRK